MLPRDLLAQSQKPAPEAAKAQQPKLPELPPASQAEADMAYDAILRKWGSRFSDAEKADLKRLVYQQQKGLDTMRAFELRNGDAPATVLKLDRKGNR